MNMTNTELLNLFEKTALGKPFNLSANTVDRYLYYINQLVAVSKKEIVDIKKADIKMYLMGLDSSDSYYNANFSAFRTLYKVLSYHPLTEETFGVDQTFGIMRIKGAKAEKEQIFLTSYQQSMLIKYAKNPRTKAILMMYLSTGLRAMELIGLTLNQYINRDVEDGNRIDLTITKGSYARSIYLAQDVVDAINDYLLVRKDSVDDNLFISDQGHKMDRSCISRTIKTVARKSGAFKDDEIERIANHTCRRSYSTTMLNEKNVPIDVVAKSLGHHGLGSVVKYARTSEEKVKVAMLG